MNRNYTYIFWVLLKSKVILFIFSGYDLVKDVNDNQPNFLREISSTDSSK